MEEYTLLKTVWFAVFILGGIAYAALDGFDIGVGCLHLFSRDDRQRRVFLNAIGPVWDGNSLWIVVTWGALFAGFPRAFAALFSALYLPTMVLIFGYILRAVAIEFRSQKEHPSWRKTWDGIFFFSSLMLAFGFGVLLANMIHGLPLNEDDSIVREERHVLTYYSALVGCFTVTLFMLHGALYLNMKTEGLLHQKIRQWIPTLFIIFLIFWATTSMMTLIYQPHMTDIFRARPYLFICVILSMIFISSIPQSLYKGWDGRAFIGSCLTIASLMSLYALGTFPCIVRSTINPQEYSLTIFNSSADKTTLETLMIVACIGLPLFVMYAIYAFRVFKGKVELDSMSY